MKHEARLTISRPSYGDGRKKIKITVADKEAVVRFLDIEIDFDKFAECITGLSEIECEMEVRGLENVGKKRESMDLVFEMPKIEWKKKKETAIALSKEKAPDGWIPSTYYGSKDSFFTKDGKDYAKTTAYRWVEK